MGARYTQNLARLFKWNVFRHQGPAHKAHVPLDLRQIGTLCKLFGNPHNTFRSIHVAGTNGKGSVTLKCATVLQTLGFKTGLFISPHISSFRERIRVNGEMITVQQVVDYTDAIFETIEREKLEVTFFEIVTMIAFLHYRDSKVDYAVIECGLGGRNDATNILERVSCATITSIGKDHEETIGPELSDIAFEKAGIIKPGLKHCVIGPTCEPFPVFQETCDTHGVNLSVIEGADESFFSINKKIANMVVRSVLQQDGH